MVPPVPLVTIKCMAFNHGPYIRQCLESLASQQCDFPFIVLVHDDASTDDTTAIIRELTAKYPDVIVPVYETENQYRKGCNAHHQAVDCLIKSKYLAFCEGDDYWCDQLKLQKQVKFMEENPDFTVCHTYKTTLDQVTGKIFSEPHSTPPVPDNAFEYLLYQHCHISFLTALMPSQIYLDYLAVIQPNDKHWQMGDYPIWLYASTRGKIGLIPEETAVYRQLPQSACHTSSAKKRFNFVKSYHDIQLFFAEKYGYEPPKWNEYKVFYDICYKYLRNHYSVENYETFCQAVRQLAPADRKKLSIRIATLTARNRWCFMAYFFIRKHFGKAWD